MANHGPVYGLDAELAAKRAAGYDPRLEAEAKEWIENLVGEKFTGTFAESLKNGQLLCKLLNKIKPGTVKKINTMSASFKMMENIGFFLDGARALGCAPTDMFQTVDLYEEKNINQVVQCIHALGRVSRTVPGFTGPFLGPKQADKNERQFSEETLKQGEAVLPMISRGSPGANASGMYDTSRDIVKGAGARERTMGKNN